MIKPIITEGNDPHNDLHSMSVEVHPDYDLDWLIPDMFDTMEDDKGIGLSAIQIGVPLRVFVICVAGLRKVFINPAIIKHSKGKATNLEGCLSIPGSREVGIKVERYKWVKVEATGLDGNQFTIKAHDLLARCLQHEIDHLDGKLISDVK